MGNCLRTMHSDNHVNSVPPSHLDKTTKTTRSLHKPRNRIPNLPKHIAEKMDKECAICLEVFAPGDIIQCLSCRHCYHNDCMNMWVKKLSTCPTCPTCRKLLVHWKQPSF